jgi:hypothetical protein
LQEVTSSTEVVVAPADWGKSFAKDQTLSRGSDSLAEVFAYVEHSEANTLALILKVSDFSCPPHATTAGRGAKIEIHIQAGYAFT